MEDLRSLKEKTRNLKTVHSANMVIYEDDLLFCEDQKTCETLDEGRISYAKVGI